MKERCAPSSKRMFPSVLVGPAETVAIAVFNRQALRFDGRCLATAVNAGTCVLLFTDGCILLAVGGGGGCVLAGG